jgi:hypothetical protein
MRSAAVAQFAGFLTGFRRVMRRDPMLMWPGRDRSFTRGALQSPSGRPFEPVAPASRAQSQP